MNTLLIRNARCVATFDHADPSQARELRDASVFIRGNLIEAMGPANDLPRIADEVIDARDHLVMPGLGSAGVMRESAGGLCGGQWADGCA